MKISMIVAVAENNAIGKNNELPWHMGDDLKHFKELTRGHAVIMGRRCYESIGKPLPERTNIIVSSNQDYEAPGCIVKNTLQSAMDYAVSLNETEVFIIGGETLYRQMLSTKSVDVIYMTKIHAVVEDADKFFPVLDNKKWKIEKTGNIIKSTTNDYDADYFICVRKEKSTVFSS